MFRVRRHYLSILIAQIVLLFMAAFMDESPTLYALFSLSLLGIFGSIIRTIWSSRFPRISAMIAALITIVSGLTWIIPGMSEEFIRITVICCAFAYAVFILIAILSISKTVFTRDSITGDMIIGSICIYFLIGMFFAFIFVILDIFSPAAVHMTGSPESVVLNFREYLYFSYVALTTTGFGDYVPTTPISRVITVIEITTGPIYLAIVVARLVGMHISQRVVRSKES